MLYSTKEFCCKIIIEESLKKVQIKLIINAHIQKSIHKHKNILQYMILILHNVMSNGTECRNKEFNNSIYQPVRSVLAMSKYYFRPPVCP